MGNPLHPDTTHGPQVDGEQVERILHYVELGKKEGAKLNCGGKKHGNTGYFIEPTVFSDVEEHMTISKEEVCILRMNTIYKILITLVFY